VSLIVALHCGAYVMVVTDTRVTYRHRPSVDGRCKLVSCRFGLVTGTGWIPLLDAVKDRLVQDADSTEEPIAAVTRLAAEETTKYCRARAIDEASEEIAWTGWIFTYHASSDEQQCPTLHLAALHPGSGLTVHSQGQSIVSLPPQPGTEAFVAAAYETIGAEAALVSPNATADELQANIAHNAALLGRLVTECAERFDSISRSFYLGIHPHMMASVVSALNQNDEPGSTGPHHMTHEETTIALKGALDNNDTLIESNRRALNVSHLMLEMTRALILKLAAGRRPTPRELARARLSIQEFQTTLATDDAALEGMTTTVARIKALCADSGTEPPRAA